MTEVNLTPAAFIGHGSPMNALEVNRYTSAWQQFGSTVQQPRAILVISAHWYINATAVTAMPKPRTIHDFYGFPRELSDFEYPAPGFTELAEEVVEVVRPGWVGLDVDTWGFDHGAWSVLTHAFPDASLPVVQLSIDASKPLEYHLELGARLAPLRERGVVIIGSGNIVHNLPGIRWDMPDTGFDWAMRFDDAVRAQMLDGPADLARIAEHPDFPAAVPMPDHLLPALYFAGLVSAADQSIDVLVQGHTYGSLSMTSYTLGSSRAEPTPTAGCGSHNEVGTRSAPNSC